MLNMKSKLKLVIVLILLQLSGCSIIAIGYHYADAYLRYSINSYATFDDAQKVFINQEVDEFMLWHRKSMLPEYISFLQEAQKVLQPGLVLKKEDVSRLRNEARYLYIKTLQPTVKPAANMLSKVSSAQIKELLIAFARENNNKKEKELSGDLDEQLRKRSERSIDTIEMLVGSLKDAQLEKIRILNHDVPFATAIYINQRVENQAALISLLENKKSEEEIAIFLDTWLIKPGFNRSVEDINTLLAFESATDEMVVSVYELLTDKQKKTLNKNIANYVNTLQKLIN